MFTVLASFVLGVVSSTIVWFYIKPLSDVASCIQQVDTDLRYYRDVITSPGPNSHAASELDEASEALRMDGAELRAATNRVPFYSDVRHLAGLPSRGAIDESYRKLIGLSNGVYEEDANRTNTDWLDDVESELEL
ncbi:hypothetical protein [Halarchaeum nitratireducens]|uniref:Uncharacterized protein n=1 Tax=Halarchaeum nitratireducens TaxID=489913 RepID=A0A830GAS1_9EURY|nr:hypothetical protein [Halarchaeum nitratireducens]GGN15898.1 hypothetical protein GCM10009021_15470 [Halarchaeum nitratireducens]